MLLLLLWALSLLTLAIVVGQTLTHGHSIAHSRTHLKLYNTLQSRLLPPSQEAPRGRLDNCGAVVPKKSQELSEAGAGGRGRGNIDISWQHQ